MLYLGSDLLLKRGELQVTDSHPTSELLGGLNAVEMRYAPESLHTAGRLDLLRRAPRISVIGSREASARGIQSARRIARVIVDSGGVVVSGLAAGIDTAAHTSAIDSGGDTIAVIGTGLDRSYPAANRELQERIANEYLLVSQFSHRSPITPKNFVMRNRTMALLSHASIIVEAGAKSGTEHQGWEAIRLGRQLFLPTPLVTANFDWPRKMMAYGAIAFDTPNDLRALIDESIPVYADERESAVPF
jgi:DNA processing protein